MLRTICFLARASAPRSLLSPSCVGDLGRLADLERDRDDLFDLLGLGVPAATVVRVLSHHQKAHLAVTSLLEDERFRGLGSIPGDGHTHQGLRENRIEALFKPIGVVEGISDVPWHKDCSLGRHSYECCNLTCGISVTGADATSGQLRVVAGSHRALMWPAVIRPG